MSPHLPYALVATDLDGTLLRSDGSVSPRTRDALAAATARGGRHVVVTGRSVVWTRPVLTALGYTGLAVCGQGGQVYDVGAHRELTSYVLDRDVARRALAAIEQVCGPLALAADQAGVDGAVLAGPGYRPDPLDGLPVVPVDAVALWEKPVRKFYVQRAGFDENRLHGLASRLAGHLVSVTKAGPGEIEILPLGLSKATGLVHVARLLGYSGAECIAFGDMPNDAPMLAWAGYAVAMGNAHPELRAVADEVAPTNDDDGVAVVLERVLSTATTGPGASRR
ncbi:HAD family hydrolase [Cellulomonas xiejunii]|uniref:Cof-type HAD-IIB family hydrolase n=1 Tax=Cellulomonas xiejunii TaxID=2968083 RepID=A0ABY5KMW8_9CELL|nr:HAD family hydrolase [Cellulomonas xiejunii]MCC2321234.1 Cof-type HAD-IIB family hydrolase [Cellulomonas xiejunii]UUI71821.1 Cof-type HAD-IIB family hydrolase [Cellulomonas xiejunii]